jgi:hypothetical protein
MFIAADTQATHRGSDERTSSEFQHYYGMSARPNRDVLSGGAGYKNVTPRVRTQIQNQVRNTNKAVT